jgi:hypothetical protein
MLLRELKDVFRRFQSQPVEALIAEINPKLRGWVNYFRIGPYSVEGGDSPSHARSCWGG